MTSSTHERTVKGRASLLVGTGVHDSEALNELEQQSLHRLTLTLKLEEERYLVKHPEIRAMVKILILKMLQDSNGKGLHDAAHHFLQPVENIDKAIRHMMDLAPNVPYVEGDTDIFKNEDLKLQKDFLKIKQKYVASIVEPPPRVTSPKAVSIPTESSSFLSIITSASTLFTPERLPTPERTLSQSFYDTIANLAGKVVSLKLAEYDILYDTAYVELMKAAEVAMEIPVIKIRDDIGDLLLKAYHSFEFYLDFLERIAAQIAWENRMRKKLKRSLRRHKNFKGHETPPTPTSEISPNDSYMEQRVCSRYALPTYNRYPKDRFGIYLPRITNFSDKNITPTPAISKNNSTDADIEELIKGKSCESRTYNAFASSSKPESSEFNIEEIIKRKSIAIMRRHTLANITSISAKNAKDSDDTKNNEPVYTRTIRKRDTKTNTYDTKSDLPPSVSSK